VQHVAPRTPFETALAGIWSELLRADGISVHDDFFEIGGHSLVAMRLVSMIRCKFDVEIPLRSIFERRTIEQLALYIAELQAEATAPEELEKLLSELESTP
jgi:acyl carrier protein